MGTSTRTRTRTPGQATPTVSYKNKTDWASHWLRAGKKVHEVTAMSLDPATGSMGPMGYAFVYGIAKRIGLATTAADRKKAKAVTIDPDSGLVTVRCDTGAVITIDRATGRVAVKKPRG
jgi:hypothetical protein